MDNIFHISILRHQYQDDPMVMLFPFVGLKKILVSSQEKVQFQEAKIFEKF